MRRLLLAPAALAALLLAPAAGQAASYKVGFSEQQATMFASPLYQQLHVGIARYVVPWDVMSRPDQQARLESWLAGAAATGARPLVSFYVGENPHRLPGVRAYTRAWNAFHRAYPFVRDVSPWNEANHASPNFAHPGARRAAQYYNVVRKRCHGCRIVGVDVLDGPTTSAVRGTVRYVKKFRHYTRRHPTRVWGLHNYSDTNRFSSKRTRKITRAMRGGQVWLTETGGIVRLGSSFHYSTTRAAKALRYMFRIAKHNHRIKRLYIYQWTGAQPNETFDAGLTDPDGTPRPGYYVVAKALRSATR